VLCRCRREAERVVGAEYPSPLSDASDGVGDGEMTRGVAGTTRGEDISTASSKRRGGSVGRTHVPVTGRYSSGVGSSHGDVNNKREMRSPGAARDEILAVVIVVGAMAGVPRISFGREYIQDWCMTAPHTLSVQKY
jgi:hypothetical protein